MPLKKGVIKDAWKKIISIENGDNDNEVIITEEINFNHPDCPLILIPNNAYNSIMGDIHATEKR